MFEFTEIVWSPERAKEVFWIVYALGVVVNLCAFYIFRSYVDKHERCNSLWYIVIGACSWPMSILAFVMVLVASVVQRVDSQKGEKR